MDGRAVTTFKEVLGELHKGESGCLIAIQPYVGQIAPDDAVSLLDAAAAYCDYKVVDELFKMFGKFEFVASALCHAIGKGDTQMAIDLAKRGATLDLELNDMQIPGDTDHDKANRRTRYLGRYLADDTFKYIGSGRALTFNAANVSGFIYRLCNTPRSHTTIVALANEELLTSRDLKGLCLSAASEGKYDLARELIGMGALNGSKVLIEVNRPGVPRMVPIQDVEDLLYPGCDRACAEFVCGSVPDRVSGCWANAYLSEDPETVRVMVPHLKSEDVLDKASLMELLARNDYRDELQTVAGWDGALTAENLQRAIEAASDAGHVGTSAWLLQKKRELPDGGGFDIDLSL